MVNFGLLNDIGMNIQTIKLELVKLILESDNPNLLESVRNLFKIEKQQDFWETLPQDQREEIIAGLDEVKEGELIDFKQFITKHK
jgi:hypothetical protein